MINKWKLILAAAVLFTTGCANNQKKTTAPQWQEVELSFTSQSRYDNPYTDVEFWVEFTHESGEKIVRPGFWDGGNNFKIRFASTRDEGVWSWGSFSTSPDDKGLNGSKGSLVAAPYNGDNPLLAKGLLRMSPGKRNVIHANGDPFLLVGDTPWALPWRGTTESATIYAQNRQERGFNAALLMSLMPDRGVTGPRSRTEPEGFDVAFEDLPDGHINQLNPGYFQYFDKLRNILIDHGIVPVYQPVFHGYGWKGHNILGWDMDAEEYARYCRYLVARFGAKPAMWLICGDSDCRNTGVIEGGEEVDSWDAYQQPTGLHYSPFCEVVPDWWDRNYEYLPHQNKVNQEKDWLDFQWSQSGHNAEHEPWKVEKMYNNLPTKAVANGEPTYEGIRDPENGAGWWQGHEAWLNFTSGGTMGVVYGAGGLWNWKLFADEPGWPDWANSNVSWREAIELSGAVYVGYFSKALQGLDIIDIEKRSDLAQGKLCLAKPGQIYIVYMPDGGDVTLSGLAGNMHYQWYNPKKGEFVAEGKTSGKSEVFRSESIEPSVLLVTIKNNN